MAVKETRADDDEGRHTTTHRELFELPGGGMVIDTPGIRELQLWDSGGIDETFSDIDELAAACRFNDCTHASEPGCAVIAALASGELPRERYESWRKLQRELRAIAIRARRAPPQGREAEVAAARERRPSQSPPPLTRLARRT